MVRPGAVQEIYSAMVIRKRTGFSALLRRERGRGLTMVQAGYGERGIGAEKRGRVFVRTRKTQSMHFNAQIWRGILAYLSSCNLINLFFE
jgi:hypothetical protein